MITEYVKGYFKRKKERMSNIKENFSEFKEIAKENVDNYKKIFSLKDIKYLLVGVLIAAILTIISTRYKYIYTFAFLVLITFYLYITNSKYEGQEKINITAIKILKIIVGVMGYNLLFTIYSIFSFLFWE